MGVVHRLACRFRLRNSRAHVEGRRTVIVLSARGVQLRHTYFFWSHWAKISALPPQAFMQRLSLSTPALGLFTPRSRTES